MIAMAAYMLKSHSNHPPISPRLPIATSRPSTGLGSESDLSAVLPDSGSQPLIVVEASEPMKEEERPAIVVEESRVMEDNEMSSAAQSDAKESTVEEGMTANGQDAIQSLSKWGGSGSVQLMRNRSCFQKRSEGIMVVRLNSGHGSALLCHRLLFFTATAITRALGQP